MTSGNIRDSILVDDPFPGGLQLIYKPLQPLPVLAPHQDLDNM